MYSAGFYPFPSEEDRWAYWARHVWANRYEPPALPLLPLPAGRRYTERNGSSSPRTWTPSSRKPDSIPRAFSPSKATTASTSAREAATTASTRIESSSRTSSRRRTKATRRGHRAVSFRTAPCAAGPWQCTCASTVHSSKTPPGMTLGSAACASRKACATNAPSCWSWASDGTRPPSSACRLIAWPTSCDAPLVRLNRDDARVPDGREGRAAGLQGDIAELLPQILPTPGTATDG